MSCKCYHADRNFLGKIGVCWGTKECEACLCGGDEEKCDFYDYVRERAKKPTTNADYIRAMSDEKLAEWFHNKTTICPPGQIMKECTKGTRYCLNCWLDWLKQEVG